MCECLTKQSTLLPLNSLPPHHVPDHLTFKPFHSTISFKTVRPSSLALRHGSTRSQRKDSWASPKHVHEYAEQYAYRTATKFRAEVQREDEQKWEWVIPKKEACSTSAKSVGSDDKRSVLPRGSVLQQSGRSTKLAAMETRSMAVQAYDLHDDDGGHRSSGAPSNRNSGWNSRDSSTAFSSLWTRFVTRAGSCQLARYRTRHERPQPELQRGIEYAQSAPRARPAVEYGFQLFKKFEFSSTRTRRRT